MFVNYTKGAFTADNLARFAHQITGDGAELEELDLTPFILSTTWVWTREYPADQVFHGGQSGGGKHFVAIEINVVQGGYDATTKSELLKRVTDAVEEYSQLPQGEPKRVYVIIREVAEANWGFDGQPINLQYLRHPPKNGVPKPL